MIARSKPNVDYNFLWECICGKGQQIDNTISNSFFFNSGASSLLFFLNLFGTKKRVGLQVFTCSTVLDVIQMAEDRVVLMDIDKDYFTTTYDIVEKHIDSIDILILSHLFGIPNPDYLRIKQLCQLRGVVLIDDLCQTFHAKIGGYFLEDLSDNYFYSFFYDKPISATSGGMLKLSDDLYTKAFDVYNALEKESDSRGKLLLRKLFWMSYLLEPQYYKYDFRNNSLWNEVLLGYYPLSCPLLLLRALLYSCIVLLITGGTGSFGNAVLRRFLDSDIKEIRIFSRDEKKQDDMRHHLQNSKVKFYIGNVRDRQSVDGAMMGVDYVFSAAALKQVPSCEFFPLQAVQTNVIGTDNVLESAIAHGVKNVVVLSTDKAAYPINAMGISKAMMEKVAIAKGRALGEEAGTTICCTRYGNVMASRGSVIPLWVEQIKNGRPITVTDPNMTRFMMTLDDAVDLVIYAFEHGHNGDLFVQKAPAATLDILAQALKETYAQVDPKYGETEVKTIGTRHGEKLYETLVTREEMAKAVDMGDYYRIPCDTRDLNYDKFFTEGNEDIARIEDYHSHNTARLDVEGMKKLLLKLRFIREDLGMEEKAKSAEIKSE